MKNSLLHMTAHADQDPISISTILAPLSGSVVRPM